MTRTEIMALEGDALWRAAEEALGLHFAWGRILMPGAPLHVHEEEPAFAILRVVRGWRRGKRNMFRAYVGDLIEDGHYWDLEPHHIARAALLSIKEGA